MRPPVCEICDADVDPSEDGALVRFQPDERSRAWRRRAEDEGIVGHPPDTGWFCAAHVEAAREAARTLSLPDGLRRIGERARAVDVTTVAFHDPSGLAAPIVVPARSADGVRRVLSERRAVLVAALGGGAAAVRSSSSFRLDDTHDRSVAYTTVGAVDVFDRVDYERVDGELVARVVETRVVRDGAVVALVRTGPFDRLQVWAGDEALRSWADAVAADLLIEPPDLVDPSPDLVGADLGSGRLMASDRFDLRWVAWDLGGIDAHELAGALRGALPALFDALQLGEPPALVTRTTRSWSPMDGAQPPYCPFTDSTFHEGATPDGPTVVVQVVLEHWNDDDVSNATVSLSIGDDVSISAGGPTGGGRTVRSVWLSRPTTAAVVRVVDQLVAPAESSGSCGSTAT